jgi:hypothetical protein
MGLAITIYMSHLGKTSGVSCIVALPFTFKSILRQKNYGNSNISPCKKYNFQKNPQKEIKILPNIIIL